jgi:hypothetical protein
VEATAHSDRLHALCSASGAERWLNCPGSVGLSLTVPEEPSSSAALEGTRAHELAEKILRQWEKDGRKLNDAFVAYLRKDYEDTEFETGDGRTWSMVDYALTYVHACIASLEVFDAGTEVAVRLEKELTFNEEMGMFGTADFMATGLRRGKGHGVIRDLKYGKKRVKVEDNPQLGYYGVALQKTSKKKLETVDVGVVQPRLARWFDGIEYSLDDLGMWDKKLTLGAEKALLQIGATKPELKTGGWCWFCPARAVCTEKSRIEAEEAFADELVW